MTLSMNFMDVYGTAVLVVIPITVTDIQNSIRIVPSKNCMKSLNRNIVFCVSTSTTLKACGNVTGIIKSKAMKISNSSKHRTRWSNLLIPFLGDVPTPFASIMWPARTRVNKSNTWT